MNSIRSYYVVVNVRCVMRLIYAIYKAYNNIHISAYRVRLRRISIQKMSDVAIDFHCNSNKGLIFDEKENNIMLSPSGHFFLKTLSSKLKLFLKSKSFLYHYFWGYG